MSESKKSTVGLDLGHKSYKACRVNSEGKHEYVAGSVDPKGLQKFIDWLDPQDHIYLETGTNSAAVARQLKKKGFRVFLLNANRLHFIFKSSRKTDKNDALNIARYAHALDNKDMFIVQIPSEKQANLRQLCHERKRAVKRLTQSKNTFYSLYLNILGRTIKRKEISTIEKMKNVIERDLPASAHSKAYRVIEEIEFYQEILKKIEAEIKKALEEFQPLYDLLTSMPGIGMINALAIIAYCGDFSSFRRGAQVAKYAGLVPRIDQSGDKCHYGHLVYDSNKYLRGLLINAAWAHLRCKQNTQLKEFYYRKKKQIGSKKAIVAVARKMIETLYAMSKTGEFYHAN